MKIYISGGITGVADYEEHFKEAEIRLVAAGNEAINPARICAGLPESTTHSEYMEVSMVLLDMCDAIYMLQGWQESAESKEEFERACAREIPIMMENEEEYIQSKAYLTDIILPDDVATTISKALYRRLKIYEDFAKEGRLKIIPEVEHEKAD